MDVYTQFGTKLTLKEPALKKGGEGAIYEIDGYPKRLAKIYLDPADAKAREGKIGAMVQMWENSAYMQNALKDDVAWPMGLLYDGQKHFIGFGMVRVDALGELNDFYIYPSKKNQHVPMTDKLKSLISLCGLTDRLHSLGQVVGDFNPDNLKVRNDFSVAFVDADSFHVNHGGQVYRCVVCAEGYVAPELIRACKGTTYAACPGQTFTVETDRFALAIPIFRTLMHGVHPFKCQRKQKPVGSTPAPVSDDQRVERGETPFFKNIPHFAPPHYAPELRLFPPYLVELFRRAFVDGHTNPKARPTAAEWKHALERYQRELTVCGRNSAHAYWNQSGTCPYCEADERHRSRWNKMKQKPIPAAPQPVTSPTPQPTPPPVPQPTPQNPTTLPQNPTPVTVTPTPPSAAGSRGPKVVYWIVTLLVSIGMLLAYARTWLPSVFLWLSDAPAVSAIGIIGTMLSGVIGTIVFNCVHIEEKINDTYGITEYIQSVGAAAVMAFAFIFLMIVGVFLFEFLGFVMGGLLKMLVAIGILAAVISR